MSDRPVFRASPEQLAASRRTAGEPFHPYWSQLELALDRPLTSAELARRVAQVIEREEILRTELQALPGFAEPVQQIFEPHELVRPDDPTRLVSQPKAAGLRVQLRSSDGARLWLAAPASHVDGPSLRSIAVKLIGDGCAIAEPGLQHADYAEWKHELLEATPPSAAVEFFRERALDPPPRIALERELPPPAAFVPASTEEVELDYAALARSTQGYGCASSAICLSVYAGLLARLSDQDEVALGYDDGGRATVLAAAIGPYATALPLRFAIARTGTLEEALRVVRCECERAAVQRECFGFASDSAYVFSLLAAPAIDGAQILEEHSVASRFKLRLTVRERTGRVSARFDYDRAVFDAQAAACLFEQWQTMLASLLRDPSQPLAAVDSIGALQRACFAVSAPPALESCSVLQLFERRAHERGSALAVVDDAGAITYRALELRANQLARLLQARGAGPGDVIGLLLPRVKDAIVAILAAHKLGAAYLPVDPEYPADRVRFMLEDSGARLCVCLREQTGSCGASEAVCLESIEDELDASPLPRADDLDALAYLIYTSGSTGRPKGVAITQRSLSHSTQVRMAHYADPVRAYLLLSSFSFDSSVAGIFWTLAQGGTLIIPSARDVMEPRALVESCARHAVSHGLSLPSVYDALLDQPAFKNVRTLQTWIVAGEVCSASVIDKHRERLPSVRLFNEYGPTEATVWATADELTHGAVRGSIGRAIAGVQLAVVNANGTPCGVGEPGEIVLGGENLARGYHRRPELTAEQFGPHPQLGLRVYRTGDRACIDGSGRVLFLGRIDRQVKIRGQRVELAEIERCLAADPRVREAVALVPADGPSQLLAFVRSDTAASELVHALEVRLRETLPSVMWPQTLRVCAELPRTPNGKLDLASLLRAVERSEAAFESPRGEVETVLCEVCAELLRLPRVSVTSDFFELGGDSISSLQLCARAASRGVTIAVREVFEHKILREVARVARRETVEHERELSLVLEASLGADDVAALEDIALRYRMQLHEIIVGLLGKDLALSRLVIEQRVAARGGGEAETYRTLHELGASQSNWDAHLRSVRAALRPATELAATSAADAWLYVDHTRTDARASEVSRCRAPLRLEIKPVADAVRLRWCADATLYTPALLDAHARAFQQQLAQLCLHASEEADAPLDAGDFPSAGLDAQSLAALLATLDR